MSEKQNEKEMLNEELEKTEEQEETRLAVSRSALYRSLEEMYNLPWEERRNLMPAPMTGSLTQYAVEMATKIAKTFGLPLTGINVIPTKAGPQIYTNYTGISYRLQVDERGLVNSDAVVEHYPTSDQPYVVARATLEFRNGERYVNYGVVAVDMTRPDTIPDAIMKAITKAKRRAGRDAVGAGLPPLFEEYLDYMYSRAGETGQVVEGTYRVVSDEEEKPPTNLAELISILPKYGMDIDKLMAMLGVEDVAEIDLKEAWDHLRALRNGTGNGK